MNDMPKQIFYVVSCNEWKEYSSFHLQILTTDPLKVRDYIRKAIENDDADYYDAELPKKEQVKHFLEDWDRERRDTINSRLEYMFYDYAYDGEEI